jgi:hypothetical protein
VEHAPVHSRLVKPGIAPNLPAEHGSGEGAPIEQDEPIGHVLHPSAEVSLMAAENVPLGHDCGDALPRGQNAPGPQRTGWIVAVGQ